MARYLYIVLLLMFSVTLTAQTDYRPGFVITDNNDTIEGFINYSTEKDNYFQCKFKKEISAFRTFYTYTAEEIKAYYIYNKRYYESREMPTLAGDKRVFVEVLVRGDITVLKYRNQFIIEKNNEYYNLNYLKDTAQKHRQLIEYHKILHELLAGCEKIHATIDNTSLERNSLIKLFEKYYSCINKPYEIYVSRFTLPDITFGILLGVNISSVNFQSGSSEFDYLTGDWNYSVKPLFGARFFIESFKRNKHLSVFSGVSIYQTKFFSEKITSVNNELETNQIRIDYFTLKIPIGLYHRFNFRKFSPFLNFGLANSFNLFSDTERKILEGNQNKETINVNFYQYGFFIGGGFSYEVNNKYELFTEVRYEKLNELERQQGGEFDFLYSNLNNYFFTIGLIFNK